MLSPCNFSAGVFVFVVLVMTGPSSVVTTRPALVVVTLRRAISLPAMVRRRHTANLPRTYQSCYRLVYVQGVVLRPLGGGPQHARPAVISSTVNWIGDDTSATAALLRLPSSTPHRRSAAVALYPLPLVPPLLGSSPLDLLPFDDPIPVRLRPPIHAPAWPSGVL